MKVAGIVVYNPNYNRLIKNVNAIYQQVDIVIIFLNSDIEKNKLIEFTKIHYLNNGENVGVAKALNEIMGYADSIGAEWCLLLDQDTVVEEDCIEKYNKYLNLESAGLLAPIVHDDKDLENISGSVYSFQEVGMCITSGSYNNVKIWKALGGFLEELFIDYVDCEYCTRLRNNGYKVYQINSVSINHQLGMKTYHFILWKRVFTYNHSAIRKYYITRNNIALHRLYPNESMFSYPYMRLCKRILYVIFFEINKLDKAKLMLKGVIDSFELYRRLKR